MWDDAASMFRGLISSGDRTQTVMVVTTVNPKKLQGNLYLNSTPVTKKKILTPITEFTTRSPAKLNMFLSNSTDQEAYFICKARIIEVLSQSGWNYASYFHCSKKDRSDTSLHCSRCVKSNVTGVVRYRVELLVDGNNCATFVVFDREMLKLTNQAAATRLLNEVNGGVDEKLSQCIVELEG